MTRNSHSISIYQYLRNFNACIWFSVIELIGGLILHVNVQRKVKRIALFRKPPVIYFQVYEDRFFYKEFLGA